MRFRRRPRIYLLLVCCAVVCFPGCGTNKARGVVKGKATFNKQPLTAGTISFVAADGRSGSGVIKSDGTYGVNDAPLGDVTITVTTPAASPMLHNEDTKPPPGVQGMPKEFLPPGYEPPKQAGPSIPVPEKYQKVASSPLKFTVQPGSQEHDIDLTP